jgi:hypothetical protein
MRVTLTPVLSTRGGTGAGLSPGSSAAHAGGP